jgi:hypothetical protein
LLLGARRALLDPTMNDHTAGPAPKPRGRKYKYNIGQFGEMVIGEFANEIVAFCEFA